MTENTAPKDEAAEEAVSPETPDFSTSAMDEAAPVATPGPDAEAEHKTRKPRAKADVPGNPPSPKGQAVGKFHTDDVSVAILSNASPIRRKSLSVHHLQRRLAELGSNEAMATGGKGEYDELTAYAVADWQTRNGYPKGALDATQVKAIFDNDSNVNVVA